MSLDLSSGRHNGLRKSFGLLAHFTVVSIDNVLMVHGNLVAIRKEWCIFGLSPAFVLAFLSLRRGSYETTFHAIP